MLLLIWYECALPVQRYACSWKCKHSGIYLGEMFQRNRMLCVSPLSWGVPIIAKHFNSLPKEVITFVLDSDENALFTQGRGLFFPHPETL